MAISSGRTWHTPMLDQHLPSHAHLLVVTQGTHDLLDLLGQLTGGGQDQALALGQVQVQVVQDACQSITQQQGLNG